MYYARSLANTKQKGIQEFLFVSQKSHTHTRSSVTLESKQPDDGWSYCYCNIVPIIMIGLPEGIQSQILSSFCDGKSISTYFHVIHCNQSLNEVSFDLIRDALVDRYKNLADCQQFTDHEEVRDVLDIIREDIRTCRMIISSDDRMLIEYGDSCLREAATTKIPDYCVIIDYFDKMRVQRPDRVDEFILWCGKLETQRGTIQKACISSRIWSVTAMDFFHDELELNNQYLTHPASFIFVPYLFEFPFGYLDILLESDLEVFNRTRFSLRESPDTTRFFLVPSQMEYEPNIGFALNQESERDCLICCWDGNDRGDFEYSLTRLAENAKRILERLGSPGG